jgi:hypothetical protein
MKLELRGSKVRKQATTGLIFPLNYYKLQYQVIRNQSESSGQHHVKEVNVINSRVVMPLDPLHPPEEGLHVFILNHRQVPILPEVPEVNLLYFPTLGDVDRRKQLLQVNLALLHLLLNLFHYLLRLPNEMP